MAKIAITLELLAGPNHCTMPTKADMQRNIEALQHAIDGRPLSAADVNLLMDTKSILIGIQEQLPRYPY